MQVTVVNVRIPTRLRGKIVPEGLRRRLYDLLNTIAARTSVAGWVVLIPPSDPRYRALQSLAMRINSYSPGYPLVRIESVHVEPAVLAQELRNWAEKLREKYVRYSQKTYPTALARATEAQIALNLITEFMRRHGLENSLQNMQPQPLTPTSHKEVSDEIPSVEPLHDEERAELEELIDIDSGETLDLTGW